MYEGTRPGDERGRALQKAPRGGRSPSACHAPTRATTAEPHAATTRALPPKHSAEGRASATACALKCIPNSVGRDGQNRMSLSCPGARPRGLSLRAQLLNPRPRSARSSWHSARSSANSRGVRLAESFVGVFCAPWMATSRLEQSSDCCSAWRLALSRSGRGSAGFLAAVPNEDSPAGVAVIVAIILGS